ncbi:ABC transporter substrate-binding protein [Shewanella mangrovi]|uniref:ABC transporter substrate-binding protein n=1 Tax=Shewanella mangrovi TaxID=1515746 RepID=A0A094JIJ6_9GAMM|nr:cobalamin-binding protein [Shewanella mangrovi]KFZ39042.1 ABC transporter substrate-binding protein [Shewanella mangrovi]
MIRLNYRVQSVAIGGCLLVVSHLCAAQATAAKPMRIVALAPHAVELLYAIGAGDEIVAATEFADYPQAAKAIPRIGGFQGIQLDRLMQLQPDLVVAWQGGNSPEMLARIKSLGFKLYMSHPDTLVQVADEMEALGKLTDHLPQAQQQAAQYRQRLNQLIEQNAHKPKVKLFYQLWSNPMMTVAKGSWVQQIIDVCQGENVFYDASSPYPQVSLEKVLLTQPQVIISSKETGNPQTIDWQRWPEIPAVNQQHIFSIDADILQRQTPRALLGMQQMCDALDKVRK